MKHLEPCPEQEMLSLLSCAQLTFMMDGHMAALHNEQVAYFSQKGTIAPDDPSVLGKVHKDAFLSRFIFVLFCFVFRQGFLPGPVPPAGQLRPQSRPHR